MQKIYGNANPVTAELVKQIHSVSYLRNSIYRDLDINRTLNFFTQRYIQPLQQVLDISKLTAVDCAAGFGWFSLAYLLAGGKAAIAVDIDTERLAAAQQIANIMNLADRMEFISSPIEKIPFPENSVDLFVSIETLEHVGASNIDRALKRIADVTSTAVLLTTPNKFFPVIAHDTRLPFVHWLPPRYRKPVTILAGRGHLDDGNEFVSPLALNILCQKFRPVSTCLAFKQYTDYREHFPFYLPYGNNEQNRWKTQPSSLQASYYKMASTVMGTHAYWVMPTLATLFISKSSI